MLIRGWYLAVCVFSPSVSSSVNGVINVRHDDDDGGKDGSYESMRVSVIEVEQPSAVDCMTMIVGSCRRPHCACGPGMK